MNTILAIVTLSSPFAAVAQNISFGVVGGASLTDGFKDQFYPNPPPFPGSRFFSESKDYLVGGMFEVRLNPKWSFEVDGLFRKLHMTQAAVLPDGSLNSVSPAPVITWEFPVLAKHRFGGRRFTPFLERGPSFRTSGNLNGTDPSHYGATARLGFELHWRSWSFAPIARYTRWAADRNQFYQATTAPNQLEILVGLSWQAESNWRPAGPRMSVGVVVGTNLTADVRYTTQQLGMNVLEEATVNKLASFNQLSGPRRFIPGAVVEFELPRRLSLESTRYTALSM